LWKILGPKRAEITWGWRKLCNEDLHTSSNITKGDVMGRACGTCGGKEKYIIDLWGNLKESDHLKDPQIDEPIILKRTLKK
jgi:hypothetical protein